MCQSSPHVALQETADILKMAFDSVDEELPINLAEAINTAHGNDKDENISDLPIITDDLLDMEFFN